MAHLFVSDTGSYGQQLLASESVKDRFEQKFVKGRVDRCWEWQGCFCPSGYGRMIFDDGIRGREEHRAHRMAYVFTYGEIPKGHGYHGTCVCHICDNRKCVNPSHLFLGSHKDNMHDKSAKGRAASFKGEQHPSAKITASDVIAIRNSGRSVRRKYWAQKLGVSEVLISQICLRKVWTHV